MKKWLFLAIVLVIVLALVSICDTAKADERLWGKWQGQSSGVSMTYTFGASGQGVLDVVFRPRNQTSYEQTVFRFFYVIERKITASSSIDTFREYIIKIWFPSQDRTGTVNVLFKKGGAIEISEDGKKLTLTRIGDNLL